MGALNSVALDPQLLRALMQAARAQAVRQGQGRTGDGCIISVSAYTRVRNGREEHVGAYQRGNPFCGDDRQVQTEPVMARRPGPFDDGRGRPPISEGPAGGANRGGGGGRTGRAPQSPPPANQFPNAQPAPERIEDILAPGGQPIGSPRPRADGDIRGMPGGDEAARAMFDRLTVGRGGIDVTPPGHTGRLVRLPDGSSVGYRPMSRSGGPAIDIAVPGFDAVRRLHY